MAATRRPTLTCPVCGGDYRNIWWHIRKSTDPKHKQAEDSYREEALLLFDSDLSAVEVSERFPFGDEVVLRLWRGEHGPKALRTRSGRLRAKERRPCERCGKPISVTAKRFCSAACANWTSAANPEANRKRAEAQKGIPRPAEVREQISRVLKVQAEEGTLPSMQPEVRAKQSATKRRQAEEGLLPDNWRKAVAALQSDPDLKKQRDVRWERTLQERYGVSNMYDIPGVRERANRAKSEAMSRRIAAGIPTNDWGRYERGWHDSPVAGRQWFQSGWERLRMEVLDTAGVTWTKSHGLRIPYTDTKGRHRYYVPDFLVEIEGLTVVEEVKGYKGKNFQVKTAAAEEWCRGKGWVFILIDTREGVHTDPRGVTGSGGVHVQTKPAKGREVEA